MELHTKKIIRDFENIYKKTKLIFEKIFNLSSIEIKNLIERILSCANIKYKFYFDKADVIKELRNDISFYDSIRISYVGIYFRPEHNIGKVY